MCSSDLTAFATWLLTLWRQWAHGVREGLQARPDVSFASLLTLVGILLAAVTDNGFVYGYVMGPAGMLTGAALGLVSPRWSPRVCTAARTAPVGVPWPTAM